MDISMLVLEFAELRARVTVAEAKVSPFGRPQELLTAIARIAAQMRELPTAGDIEATVKSATEAKLPEAIQAWSAVIMENIMESMTFELNRRIAENTAHFAIKTRSLLLMAEWPPCRSSWPRAKTKWRPSAGMRGNGVPGA